MLGTACMNGYDFHARDYIHGVVFQTTVSPPYLILP